MSTEKAVNPSLLAQLRAVQAQRDTDADIALRIAERQATHFSESLALTGLPVPTESITALQRVHVETVHDLPVRGCCFWDAEHTLWIIHISSRETSCQQRSTILHEYKHIIDHGRGDLLYGVDVCASDRAEEAADHFAACVLIPETPLHSLWTSGVQHISDLARAFDAPTPMVKRRLTQLSLNIRANTGLNRARAPRHARSDETPEPPSAFTPTTSKEPYML